MSNFNERKTRKGICHSPSSQHWHPKIPETPPSLDIAGKLYNEGRLKEAHQRCGIVLAQYPENPKILLLMAMIERGLGDLIEASRLAEQAISLFPNYADAYVNLGAIYYDQEKFSLALKKIKKGISIEPDHPLGLILLAKVQKKQQNLAEAEQTTRKLIELKPGRHETYNSLGSILKGQGRISEAETVYKHALNLRRDYIPALYNLSRVHHFYPGDPIIEDIKEHLNNDKLKSQDRARLLFALSWAYDCIKEYQSAFSYLSEANDLQASITQFNENKYFKIIEDIFSIYAQSLPEIPPATKKAGHQGTPIPIFIIGPSRSGKTLIESLLARSHKFHALGENNEFILTMDAFAKQRKLQDDFPLNFQRVPPKDLLNIGATYRQRLAAYNPKSRFAISTLPGYYKYVAVILQSMPDARVIFCRRNAMDNGLRIFFTNYKDYHPYAYNQRVLARYLTTYWQLLELWKTRFEDRILNINYEDLVTNSRSATETIANYIGINSTEIIKDFDYSLDEIGHWRNYAKELTPMQNALHEYAELYNLH